MGTIHGLLVVALAIFSIYSLISHMGNHGNLKKEHETTMSGLSSSRRMTHKEYENFKKIFKINLPDSVKVYKHRGTVSFIGIEVNHTEQKEFSIGGIRIHNKSYIKLAKKKFGIKLDEYIPDPKLIEAELNSIQKRLEEEKLSEEEAKKEIQLLEDSKMSHDFEFVFAKEENPGKQAAFIISIGDWKIADCQLS